MRIVQKSNRHSRHHSSGIQIAQKDHVRRADYEWNQPCACRPSSPRAALCIQMAQKGHARWADSARNRLSRADRRRLVLPWPVFKWPKRANARWADSAGNRAFACRIVVASCCEPFLPCPAKTKTKRTEAKKKGGQGKACSGLPQRRTWARHSQPTSQPSSPSSPLTFALPPRGIFRIALLFPLPCLAFSPRRGDLWRSGSSSVLEDFGHAGGVSRRKDALGNFLLLAGGVYDWSDKS